MNCILPEFQLYALNLQLTIQNLVIEMAETKKQKLPANVSKHLYYQAIPLHFQAIAGILSGFFVSPLNTIVDRSVIENANGKMPLWKGVGNGLKQLLTTPNIFFRSYQFRWIFFVYSTTYLSSNMADHVDIPGIQPAIIKLTISFLVNTTASLIKDKALAQHFSKNQVTSFPLKSYGLFLLRDIVAMASAFTLPPILGHYLSQEYGIQERRAEKIGQLISPLLVQTIGTPLHLLGLDFYNHPQSTGLERFKYLKSIYMNNLLLRMMRFLPAYGLGGIANIEMRRFFRENYGHQKSE